MFKQKTLRYIFAISVLLTIIFPSINAYFIYPTFTRLLISFTETEAARLADHFKNVVVDHDTIMAPDHFIAKVNSMQEKFHLMKLKVFLKTGETLYSTDPADIGVMNTKPYFINNVAKGEIYTKFVQKNNRSLENQIVSADVVETYVPIMSRGSFLGAFEIYYDITARKKKLDELIFYSSFVPLAIMLIFLLMISVGLFKLDRSVARRQKVENALKKAHDELELQVEERTAELTESNVKLIQEISARTGIETKLRQTRNYLDNLINSMPSVLIGINHEGRVTQWNNEAEKISGLSSQESTGRLIEEVLPYDAEQMEKLRDALREKKPDSVERLIQHKDEETHYFDMIVYPLQKIDGGAVIRIDDVTARVKLENMIVQTEKMMSVGGLAAGMAHEINNPLSGIIQSIQNTLRRFSPEMKKNIEIANQCGLDLEALNRYMQERSILTFLEGINSSALRAAKIVRGMLTFSRASEPIMFPVNLVNLIEKTVDLAAKDYDLKKSYDFRHIKIHCNFSKDLPDVPCLETELEQVILNLLRNAAQAMRENEEYMVEEPLITIKTMQSGGNALIIVKDNGPGMDTKTAKRAFEPFFTTKKPGVGTGLGLSVSYFIITENHGGSMTVESAKNSGAKFTISLPLQRS